MMRHSFAIHDRPGGESGGGPLHSPDQFCGVRHRQLSRQT
jgi:hypothetical protein